MLTTSTILINTFFPVQELWQALIGIMFGLGLIGFSVYYWIIINKKLPERKTVIVWSFILLCLGAAAGTLVVLGYAFLHWVFDPSYLYAASTI
jgi:hypothetical protein